MILTQGKFYDLSSIRHNGWTRGDNTGHEGYDPYAYFDQEGVFLGPNKHGIEPVFTDKPFPREKS